MVRLPGILAHAYDIAAESIQRDAKKILVKAKIKESDVVEPATSGSEEIEDEMAHEAG